LLTSAGFTQSEEVRKKNFNIKKNGLLEGYDPVSYFGGKPLEGKEDIKSVYRGVAYHFASQDNLNQFKNQSRKYEPAYGGWCAYAMGETGEKVRSIPKPIK